MPIAPLEVRFLRCCGPQADLPAGWSLPIRYAASEPWLVASNAVLSMKRREFIRLLGLPDCDALYFMRGVKILGLSVTRPEALHEDMK